MFISKRPDEHGQVMLYMPMRTNLPTQKFPMAFMSKDNMFVFDLAQGDLKKPGPKIKKMESGKPIIT